MVRNARPGGGRLHGNIHDMPTALITGGTGGLGVSVVEAFLAAGWRVVVTYIVEGEQERLPDAAEAVYADLVDPDDVGRAVRVAAGDDEQPAEGGRQPRRRLQGRPAGGRHAARPTSRRCSSSTCARRTSSPRRALPRLVAAGGGAIVCVSSKAAFEPWAGGSGYAASKAAVAAFARAVAKEHADEGVRCNVIAPTMIDTPANRAANPDAKMTPPEQVASLIRFLCSDESAALNGAVLPF